MALLLRGVVMACLIVFSQGQVAKITEDMIQSGPASPNMQPEPISIELMNNNRRQNDSGSPLCLEVKTCQRRGVPVCGYDEEFGFGKFDNFCHMLEVNCYWNYKFSIHSCSPLYLKKIPRPTMGQVQN